jgi:hypothetical protein
MCDHVERRGTTSKIPKSAHYKYNANFQLTVLKHADETNNCHVAWKFHVTEQNVLLKKTKEIIINESNSTQKAFYGPKQGNFNATD